MSLSVLLKPRLCELGKIKIGGLDEKVRKTAGGREWRAPMKYDHFIVTTLNRSPAGDLVRDEALMEALAEKYADKDGKLRQIPITLLSDDIEDCMQSAYVWYDGKRIGARSDGVTLTWYVNPKNKEQLAEPKTVDWKPEYADSGGGKMFKLHTTFNCVITATDARWGGLYKLRTTSRITADQLYGSLLHLQQLTSGILRGLPLVLVVRPMQVTPDGKPTTVYVVHVELRGKDLQSVQQLALQMAQFQLSNAQTMKQTQIEFRKLLAAPGENETPAEIEDVAQEFHPETVTEDVPPVENDPLAAAMGLEDGAETTEGNGASCLCPPDPDGIHLPECPQGGVEATEAEATA